MGGGWGDIPRSFFNFGKIVFGQKERCVHWPSTFSSVEEIQTKMTEVLKTILEEEFS